MMQILEAGGLPVLCDGLRAADSNNPRGYYELEKVKALERDASWICEAEGKVIKVISALLYHLPKDHKYRVIWMNRQMNEVLASQSAMLGRLGQQKGPEDTHMAGYFEKHLAKLNAWLPLQTHMSIFRCSYNDLLADPKPTLTSLRDFIGSEIDLDRMLSAIDPKLYRQKAL